MHATSAVCAGQGSGVLNLYSDAEISPALIGDPHVTQLISYRNHEVFHMLSQVLMEMFGLGRDVMKPPVPSMCYAIPLLRLQAVLVIDIIQPLLTYLGPNITEENEFYHETCSVFYETSKLLLQTTYIPEENAFNNYYCRLPSEKSQLCFVGAALTFRVKQDHIGCVSLTKLSSILKKLCTQEPSTKVVESLSQNFSLQPINKLLPNLLCSHLNDDIIADEASAFSSHIFTEVIPFAKEIYGERSDTTEEVVVLWIKCFIHHLISFVEIRNENLASMR